MVNLSQVDCYYDETVVIRKRGKLLVPKVTCTCVHMSSDELYISSMSTTSFIFSIKYLTRPLSN